jgi:hypothetical protein
MRMPSQLHSYEAMQLCSMLRAAGGGGGLFRATLASLSKGDKNNFVNFLGIIL